MTTTALKLSSIIAPLLVFAAVTAAECDYCYESCSKYHPGPKFSECVDDNVNCCASRTWKIVLGAVVGGLVCCACIAGIICCILMNRSQRRVGVGGGHIVTQAYHPGAQQVFVPTPIQPHGHDSDDE